VVKETKHQRSLQYCTILPTTVLVSCQSVGTSSPCLVQSASLPVCELTDYELNCFVGDLSGYFMDVVSFKN